MLNAFYVLGNVAERPLNGLSSFKICLWSVVYIIVWYRFVKLVDKWLSDKNRSHNSCVKKIYLRKLKLTMLTSNIESDFFVYKYLFMTQGRWGETLDLYSDKATQSAITWAMRIKWNMKHGSLHFITLWQYPCPYASCRTIQEFVHISRCGLMEHVATWYTRSTEHWWI